MGADRVARHRPARRARLRLCLLARSSGSVRRLEQDETNTIAPIQTTGDPVERARNAINSVLPSVSCTWLDVAEPRRERDRHDRRAARRRRRSGRCARPDRAARSPRPISANPISVWPTSPGSTSRAAPRSMLSGRSARSTAAALRPCSRAYEMVAPIGRQLCRARSGDGAALAHSSVRAAISPWSASSPRATSPS